MNSYRSARLANACHSWTLPHTSRAWPLQLDQKICTTSAEGSGRRASGLHVERHGSRFVFRVDWVRRKHDKDDHSPLRQFRGRQKSVNKHMLIYLKLFFEFDGNPGLTTYLRYAETFKGFPIKISDFTDLDNLIINIFLVTSVIISVVLVVCVSFCSSVPDTGKKICKLFAITTDINHCCHQLPYVSSSSS